MMMSVGGNVNLHFPVTDCSSTMTTTPTRPEPVKQITLLFGRRTEPPKLVKLWRGIIVPSALAAKMMVLGSLVSRASFELWVVEELHALE